MAFICEHETLNIWCGYCKPQPKRQAKEIVPTGVVANLGDPYSYKVPMKKKVKIGDWVSYEYGQHDENVGHGEVLDIKKDEHGQMMAHLHSGVKVLIVNIKEVRSK